MQPTAFADHNRSSEDHDLPVLVVACSPSDPELHQRWLDVWRSIGTVAEEWPGCAEFRLVREHGEPHRFAACMRFASATEFAQFVRESGILWMDRLFDQGTKYEIFETLSESAMCERARHEPPLGTRQRIESALITEPNTASIKPAI